MKREDDQELWDLLGNVPTPALSPFFSRNVVRRVRAEANWRHPVAEWFTWRKLIPAAAVAVAIGLAAISIQPSADDADPDNLPAIASAIDPQDYQVVADLDDLLAAEDDNVWDDTESLSL